MSSQLTVTPHQSADRSSVVIMNFVPLNFTRAPSLLYSIYQSGQTHYLFPNNYFYLFCESILLLFMKGFVIIVVCPLNCNNKTEIFFDSD